MSAQLDHVLAPELMPFAKALDEDGLTILPPDVTGVDLGTVDRCVEVLLAKFEKKLYQIVFII